MVVKNDKAKYDSDGKYENIGFIIASRLNTYFSLLTTTNKVFDIAKEKTIWDNYIPNAEGVILVSVHLPLVKVAIGTLLDENLSITGAIAGNPTKDGMMFFGEQEKKLLQFCPILTP